MPTETKRQTIDRLTARYPAILSAPEAWAATLKLIQAGKVADAEVLARTTIAQDKKLVIRNKIAVRHRLARREFLSMIRDAESEVRKLFDDMADRISRLLVNNAGDDGRIPLHRSRPLLDRIKQLNRDTWSEFNILLARSVRQSVRYGLTVTMDSAQDGLALNKNLSARESDRLLVDDMLFLLEAEKKAAIARTSVTFKTLYDRVKKRRLVQGLFKNRTIGGFQFGHKLSQAVWDLRDGNLQRLRRQVSTGIAQGRAAVRLANEIKSMTTVATRASKSTVAAVPGASGVYKSAYKNALRMVRTETNVAYHEAEIEYAAQKGYRKVWHTSTDPCPICMGLDGREFLASEIPPLPHPNCSCFLTTVIPGIS